MSPVVTIRYFPCSFIMLPIKAGRACNPFLSSKGGFITTASNCSAHALIRFQPRPPRKQQRWISVNDLLLVAFLPPGCNCVLWCVFCTALRTLNLQLETHRCVQMLCVFTRGSLHVCFGQVLAVLLLTRILRSAVCTFPYRRPWVSELICQRLLKDLNVMKTQCVTLSKLILF